MTSKHYTEDRKYREDLIQQIGEGTIVYEIVKWDEKRKRYFLYQVTDNAIIIVRAADNNMIITKLIARPSRLKAYWDGVTDEIMNKAVEHARAKMYK